MYVMYLIINNFRRYYECSLRKNQDIQCRVKLQIKNGQYILNGKHEHDKPVFQLADIKKEINSSQAFESTRIIKKKIISKLVRNG